MAAIPLDSVVAMAAALRAGTLASAALVSAFLARIRAQNGWLHAFVEVYEEEAMAMAEAADASMRAGVWLGPLHGIPVAIKDLIDIEGRVTTCGSPIFSARRAAGTAPIVQRLRAAGAIVVGKTHMVQFALGAWGTNEHMGTPRNPWDHEIHRTPGGSSSGSAVAVAAGLVPLSIGTDTGGSVRVPASFCGITGLKVTAGRIDTAGVMPLSTTLDSIGVFARTAEDAALVYAVLVDGPDARPESPEVFPGSEAAEAFAGLRFARLGDADLAGIAPDVRTIYEAAVDVLRRGGAQIRTLELPRLLDDFAQTASAIMLSEGAAEYGDLALDAALPVDASVRPRLVAGTRITGVQYVRAARQRLAWKREFEALLARFDALVMPSTATAALALRDVNHDQAPVRFTRVGNLLDMCGISLPAGLDGEGLPVGVQLLAPEGADAALLAMASQFQKLTDWHRRVPAAR